MSTSLRDTVPELMERHHVPGLAVAVTDARQLLCVETFGRRDLMSGGPVTPDTRFLWFSMSKIVTATVAMRLVGTGQLDLDAPVDSLVPGFRARAGARPVVRQLMNHTAGAPNPLPIRWVRPAAPPTTTPASSPSGSLPGKAARSAPPEVRRATRTSATWCSRRRSSA
jgi:CubicO group peptidase (beta-lactamase class C family)